MTTQGRGTGANENQQSFQPLALRLFNTEDMYDPASVSVISQVRQIQAVGLSALFSCCPAPDV